MARLRGVPRGEERHPGKSGLTLGIYRLSVLSGLPPESLLELEQDELDDLVEFVTERAQGEAWTNSTELLAQCRELLDAINQRLGAGVPVVMAKKVGRIKTKPVKRPDWVKKAADAVRVMSPREFFGHMLRR